MDKIFLLKCTAVFFVYSPAITKSRLGWIDGLLDTITDYASLEPRQVVELAQQISARFITIQFPIAFCNRTSGPFQSSFRILFDIGPRHRGFG